MSITARLSGKTIAEVWRNGALMVIRFTDGTDVTIGWRDSDTGAPLKGEPVVLGQGLHVTRGATVFHRREVGL